MSFILLHTETSSCGLGAHSMASASSSVGLFLNTVVECNLYRMTFYDSDSYINLVPN